jgi:hypothetical protein
VNHFERLDLFSGIILRLLDISLVELSSLNVNFQQIIESNNDARILNDFNLALTTFFMNHIFGFLNLLDVLSKGKHQNLKFINGVDFSHGVNVLNEGGDFVRLV